MRIALISLLLPVICWAADYELQVRSNSRIDTVLVETHVTEYLDCTEITDTYEIIQNTECWYVEVYPDGHEEPSYRDYLWTSYYNAKYKPWETLLKTYKVTRLIP